MRPGLGARPLRWVALWLAACASSATEPPAAPSAPSEPRWEGVLEPTPELVVVIRPQAVRRDPVYGPLVERAVSLARARNPLALPTETLVAMKDADEVVLVARDVSEDGLGELAIVVRGARASVDPAAIVDERGRPLWVPGPSAPRLDVRELVRAPDGDGTSLGSATDASLFELPGRTWVIASGRARVRARDAFARPGHASLDLDSAAPVAARVSGPALVARIEALRPPGLLASVGHELQSVSLSLTPGEKPLVRATFTYRGVRAAASAEATVREVLAALSKAQAPEYDWLRPATVQATSCCVSVTTPVPSRLVNGLLH